MKENYYMEKVPSNETEEAYFCGHLETLNPADDMKGFNDEKFFQMVDPIDQDDQEIYGEQYRHFEEIYEEEAWPLASDVEKDVGTTSPIPPSVAVTSTGTSPAEPAREPKFGIFEVVSSSHSVAGGSNQSNSRYKVQCAAIGVDIGEDGFEDFCGDEILWTPSDFFCTGEQPKIIISPMTTAGPGKRDTFHPSSRGPNRMTDVNVPPLTRDARQWQSEKKHYIG